MFVHIGAVLDPGNENWRFLEGKPIKTRKIRGLVSQGLIGPLSWAGAKTDERKEGEDVTALLGARKYVEKEESAAYTGGSKPHPSWIPRTDAERVQNLRPAEWRDLVGQVAHVSRKENGTSATYYWTREEGFGMAGRNYVVDSTSHAHYRAMALKFELETKLEKLGRDRLAIQGEIVGPGINGNRLGLSELDFRVFDVFDGAEGCYLPQAEVMALAFELDLHCVPVVSREVTIDEHRTAAFWLALAEKVDYAPGVPAEGIVIRIEQGKLQRRYKAVANGYLLKHGL